jgi:hypothetical protein
MVVLARPAVGIPTGSLATLQRPTQTSTKVNHAVHLGVLKCGEWATFAPPPTYRLYPPLRATWSSGHLIILSKALSPPAKTPAPLIHQTLSLLRYQQQAQAQQVLPRPAFNDQPCLSSLVAVCRSGQETTSSTEPAFLGLSPAGRLSVLKSHPLGLEQLHVSPVASFLG